MTDRFAIFQLDDDPELDCIRGASYNDLQHSRIFIDPANYVQMYMSGIRDDDTPMNIVRRLREYPPADIPCDGINTSDVLVIVLNDNEIAYYIDGDRLVLIPHFLKASGDSRIVALDGDTYAIEGKSGLYKPVGQMIAHTNNDYGIPYFIMQNVNDPKQLHILVSVDGKVICENFDRVTNDVQVRATRHLDTWQKYYENGEYLRALGDFAGGFVNYSRVDGSRGNQDRDYTEEVRQAQVGRGTGKIREEAERQRAEQQLAEKRREEQKSEEVQHKSLDERLANAHRVRDERMNGIDDGQSMPGQAVSQGQRPAPAQQDNLSTVLSHLSVLESNINARFATIEQRMNSKESRETRQAVRKKDVAHSAEEMIPGRENR